MLAPVFVFLCGAFDSPAGAGRIARLASGASVADRPGIRNAQAWRGEDGPDVRI